MRHNPLEPNFKPIGCVCTNIKKASRVVGRSYDAAIEKSGVNVVQYSILINISRVGSVALSQLAEHLEMERTTLYRAIDILERDGLIKTEPLPVGKARAVKLTAKGKALTAHAEKQWKHVHESFVEKFGEQKLRQFNEMLSQVSDHFKD